MREKDLKFFLAISLLAALLVSCTLIASSVKANGEIELTGRWVSIGPDGGDMHFVYITRNHVLFISHGFGGVWRSTDRGETSILIYNPEWIDLNFMSMAEVDDVLFAGGNYGLWMSTDEGLNWSRVETGYEYLDCSPSKYEVVSIVALSRNHLYFSVRIDKRALSEGFTEVKHGFFELENGSLTFHALPEEASTSVVVMLAYDQDFNGRELLFVSSSEAGLYVYDLDSGEWEKILDKETTRVALDEEDIVYVGTIGDWYYKGWYSDGWQWEHIVIPDKTCAIASFIVPDPYNKDRLWVGADGQGGRVFMTNLTGSSFVAVGFWIDGEWHDLKIKGNYATMIAIDVHGEGEDPDDYTIDTPYGRAARYAFVPQGGKNSIMRTDDGGETWVRAYGGVYGDTINKITYLDSGVRRGDLVVTCVSGNQISNDLGESWEEGIDFTLGNIGYGLPGYAWDVASPPQELEGVYDLLVATGYPSPPNAGNGVYAVDTDSLKSGEGGLTKRLTSSPSYDIVIIDNVAYIGNMDSGVDVLDLQTYEVTKLPGIPEDEAGQNLLYNDGDLIIWTIKGVSKTSDSYFFTERRSVGGIYVYSDGECRQIYYGARVISVSAHGSELVALTVEGKFLHFTNYTMDREVSLPIGSCIKYSDMVVDWENRIVYISTFDSYNPGVLYTSLDSIWEEVDLKPLEEGLMTRRVRCLEIVNGTLFAGTEGHSVWKITPEISYIAPSLEPPSISIAAPSQGSSFQVGETITIVVEVAGEEIKNVTFYVNGELMTAKTVPPWTATWDTSSYAAGTYNVTVKVTNPAGSSSDSVIITLTAPISPPTVVITSPSAGSSFQVGAQVAISASVIGEQVESVTFSVNGQPIATRTSPPWTATWNTQGLNPGTYTITVTATNPAGTHTDTITVTLTQPTAPPSQGAQPTQPSRCIIATVAFNSEIAPEVQTLRQFRDNIAMKTYTGSAFMTAFNTWYYTWSPQVAQAITNNEPAKATIRTLIQPLLTTLHIATQTYNLLQTNPELAIVTAGITTSAIIGTIYVTPPLILASMLMQRLRRTMKVKPPRMLAMLWLISLFLVAASLILHNYQLAMFSTSALVLLTISCTAKAWTWMLMEAYQRLSSLLTKRIS